MSDRLRRQLEAKQVPHAITVERVVRVDPMTTVWTVLDLIMWSWFAMLGLGVLHGEVSRIPAPGFRAVAAALIVLAALAFPFKPRHRSVEAD